MLFLLRWFAQFITATGLFVVAGSAWATELQLNGSAIYSHLTRDYYQAALYLEQKDNSASAVSSSTADKQMRLLVTSRWKPRNWQKLWQAKISINNEVLPSNPDSSNALMAFIRLPKDDLQPGDEIIIRSSAKGTEVFLNDELAISTRDRALFRYLLNTWIGKFPPSREFRGQLLKMSTSAALQQQLQNHQIPDNRLKLLSAWREKDRQEQQRLKQKELKAQQAKELARKKQQQLLQAKREKAAAEKRFIEQQRKRQAAEKAAKAAKEKIRQQRIAQAAQKKSEELKRQQTQNSAAEKQRILQQQQTYYRDLYQWQLQRALEQEIRYPAWAKQFGQQGEVLLTLKLDSAGEIINSEHQLTEQPELLLEEVERASRIVSSQVKPPATLTGSPWTYTLGYRFSLAGKPQPTQNKPQLPSSLRGQAGATNLAEDLTRYKQRVREKILSKLVYPKAARILKKHGETGYKLVLDKSGEVAELTQTVANRHRELNKSLEKAIISAAPFGEIPGGKPIIVPISYHFKI